MEFNNKIPTLFLNLFLIEAVALSILYLLINFGINLIKKNKAPKNSYELYPQKYNNNFIKITTILLDFIFILIFPISCLTALSVPMTFDAPGSTEVFLNWVFFYLAIAFPLVILISISISLIFFIKLKSYKNALIFSVLPILYIFIIFLIS